jgi:hypothetical protein
MDDLEHCWVSLPVSLVGLFLSLLAMLTLFRSRNLTLGLCLVFVSLESAGAGFMGSLFGHCLMSKNSVYTPQDAYCRAFVGGFYAFFNESVACNVFLAAWRFNAVFARWTFYRLSRSTTAFAVMISAVWMTAAIVTGVSLKDGLQGDRCSILTSLGGKGCYVEGVYLLLAFAVILVAYTSIVFRVRLLNLTLPSEATVRDPATLPAVLNIAYASLYFIMGILFIQLASESHLTGNSWLHQSLIFLFVFVVILNPILTLLRPSWQSQLQGNRHNS